LSIGGDGEILDYDNGATLMSFRNLKNILDNKDKLVFLDSM